MQRPVLREPSLMQCIAVKDSKMFSSAVACNSTDDTDPLEDSTAQVVCTQSKTWGCWGWFILFILIMTPIKNRLVFH